MEEEAEYCPDSEEEIVADDKDSPLKIQSESASEEAEQGADGDSPVMTQDQMRERREKNIAALLSNSLQLQRKALLPRVLNVEGAEATLRAAFKSPFPDAPARSDALRRKLLKRKVFVPWGSNTPFKVLTPQQLQPATPPPDIVVPEEDAGEPLVLWEPPAGAEGRPVAVDGMLTRWLRPHQREGVAFMFECVCALRDFEGSGCILADDMGLGKTLQGITLLWTLLQNGHELLGGTPIAKRIIICCPTSLVSNWDSECCKWLKGRVRTLPLSESSREDVISSIAQFLSPKNFYQVLILSYETFRIHADRFKGERACDLLICDEAHRLKNDQTLINKALYSLACKRRVLLSGTPMQNHLDEFFAMVDFCNPGVLGTPAQFRRRFEGPIVAGREPTATEAEVARGTECSNELSAIVNAFILRRTNALLSAHLPPKVVEVVCCRPSELQTNLYNHFLRSNSARRMLSAAAAAAEGGGGGAKKGGASALTAINALRKLCGHPKLIYDLIHPPSGKLPAEADGFKDCDQFFPPGLFDDGRAGRCRGALPPGWHALSGKMAVLAAMLARLRSSGERIVVVSNSTQVLDLIGQLCRESNYPVLRLDGSTSLKKRTKMVQQFNGEPGQFVFLLSSKAGGCGINLIGGNRLVLFDPDWNPANDKQAAARVWRDGQERRVYVYRFLTTGTIEEKVFQRQLSKEGLQQLVNNSSGAGGGGGDGGGDATSMSAAAMSSEDLRDLFRLRAHTASDTYDAICCADEADEAADEDGEDPGGIIDLGTQTVNKEQVDAPAEEDLKSWGQHSSTGSVPDAVMRSIGAELPGLVSFVFSCKVAGKAIEGDDEDGLAGTSGAAGADGGGAAATAAAAGATAAVASSPVTPAPAGSSALPARRRLGGGGALSAPSRMRITPLARPPPVQAPPPPQPPPPAGSPAARHPAAPSLPDSSLSGKENAEQGSGAAPSGAGTPGTLSRRATPLHGLGTNHMRPGPGTARPHTLGTLAEQKKKSPLAEQRGGKATSLPSQPAAQLAKKQKVAPVKMCWPDDADSDDDFK